MILPFIGVNNYSANPFYQWQSPFEQALSSPISLINVQVQVGGNNVLQNTYFASNDMFIQQQSIYEQLTSADWGVNVGLFNQ